MSINRREFLATSVVIGAAAAATTRVGIAPSPDRASMPRVQILRSAHAQPEAFEQGARAALQAAGVSNAAISSLDLPAAPNLAEWQSMWSGAEGTMLVGMVAESDFVFVNEIIREKGGRLLCQGTHLAGDPNHSRHAFSTTASSAGMGAFLAGWLRQQQQHASVREVARSEPAAPLRARSGSAPGGSEWAETLGGAFAEVAMGRWEPIAIEPDVRVGAGDDFKAARASYVSFVAAV